jgi:DNA (cytosine-5)-methyltransferase 1
MRTLHLFAGAGGGLLADLILGHEPVAAVEWDRYACQVLRERAAEGWLPGLRVHEGDVRLFDPSEYAGRVDCIHAGFPCQDISHAGKQAGVGADTRSGLYREVLRIADIVRPRFLFLENVAAILSNGLGTVLGDLAARGYDCRWTCIRAADVGAPHRRDRWWCLARRTDVSSHADNGGYGRREQFTPGAESAAASICDTGEHGESTVPVDAEASGLRGDVADADPGRQQVERLEEHGNEQGECWREPDGLRAAGRWSGPTVADAQLERLEGIEQGRPEAWTVGGPGDGCDPCWWESEPDVGRVAHGVASELDKSNAHQAEQRPQSGSEIDGTQDVRTVSADDRIRSASQGPRPDEQRARESGSALPVMPSAGAHHGWGLGARQGADCDMRDMRCSVSAETLEASDVVRQQGMRDGERQAQCGGSLGWWDAEPDVGRVASGVVSRVDRLKALGNGQVPLQAALAWRILTA